MTLKDIILELDLQTCDHYAGTDKYSIHQYVQDFYEHKFKEYQEKEPIRLLEIGTMTGASLLLWQKYFSKSEIFGMDKDDKVLPKFKDERIKYIIRNAYNVNSSTNLGDFDIVIDDGPHTIQSYNSCLDIYLPKVKEGGILIIEDIVEEDFISSTLNKFGTDYECGHLDNREKSGCNNSQLIWIKK